MIAIACTPILGCQPALPDSQRASTTEKFEGVVALAFERGDFVSCSGSEDCNTGKRGCWLEGSDQFWARLEQAIGPIDWDEMKPSYLRAEFTGRRDEGAGPFGHMDKYKCQITADRLISARRIAAPNLKVE